MKVLHIINAFEPDGPGRLTLDLAVRLTRNHGAECRVAALSRGGPLRREFEAAGVPADVVGGRPLSAALRLERLIREFRPDVAHTHLLRADLLGRWAAARIGVRAIVSTEHGIHTWDSRGRRWRPWIARAFRYTARRAARIVAVSRYVRDALAAEKIAAEKIAVIYNGVDMARFQPLSEARRAEARRAFGVDPAAPLLVAAGTMAPLKGHADLVLALPPLLHSRERASLRAIIAGDGPERARCERLARGLGLGERLRFVGHIGEDLPRLLGCADLLVQPSRMESFGLAVAEAMACGVPELATRVGGLPETIADGATGFLVKPRGAAALSTAIGEALRDPDRLRAMGRAARQRAEQRFDADSMAHAYFDLYAQCLG